MTEWPHCPDCGSKAEFLQSSASLYGGRDYGPMYVCRPCDTRVGCHKNSKIPLGIMAGKKIRSARMKAHEAFDPIWDDDKWPEGEKAPKRRTAAYRWLAKRMKIPRVDHCHIGWFDVEDCMRVVEYSEKYLRNWEQRKREKARKEAEWD